MAKPAGLARTNPNCCVCWESRSSCHSELDRQRGCSQQHETATILPLVVIRFTMISGQVSSCVAHSIIGPDIVGRHRHDDERGCRERGDQRGPARHSLKRKLMEIKADGTMASANGDGKASRRGWRSRPGVGPITIRVVIEHQLGVRYGPEESQSEAWSELNYIRPLPASVVRERHRYEMR